MMYDTGRLTSTGKKLLSPKTNPRLPFEQHAIPVPCGKCSACLERRKSEWISRLRLECFSSPAASFVTLTYRDNPESLIKSDIQRFLKRLRQSPRDFGVSFDNLRYFVVGEYGKKFHRPHWHGIFFGVNFLDQCWHPSMVAFKDGHPVYSSSVLSSIWSHGFITCDVANDLNIRYVAKYCVKDNPVVLRSQGLGRSLFVDVRRHGRKSSYRLRSLFSSVALDGRIMLPDKNKGLSPVGIPKSFDSYLERCDDSLFQRVKASRRDFVSNLPFDTRSVSDCERTINVFQSVNQSARSLDDET